MIIKANYLGSGKGLPCRSGKPLPQNRLSLYRDYSEFFASRKPFLQAIFAPDCQTLLGRSV